MPGFVDVHTHYDAQLYFEPSASPSSWHGVTTVLTGNCGFTIAPSKPDDLDWLVLMLAKVEGHVRRRAARRRAGFAGGIIGDFLRGLDGRIGVNIAMYVGHAAVRRWVMGAAASERAATDDEIRAMQALVDDAMRDGALGLSTSQLDVHADHEGKPRAAEPRVARGDRRAGVGDGGVRPRARWSTSAAGSRWATTTPIADSSPRWRARRVASRCTSTCSCASPTTPTCGAPASTCSRATRATVSASTRWRRPTRRVSTSPSPTPRARRDAEVPGDVVARPGRAHRSARRPGGARRVASRLRRHADR